MSYIINNTRGQVVAVVADGTVNTTATDLSLVGRAVINYGTFENENYIYLLENFANPTAPLQPVLGQLWYNNATDVISTYGSGNAWIPLATQEYVQLQKVSPAFTGIPTAPTAATGTATTQLATTAFVTNSPQFAGVPRAPTAATGTATTQLATTAFVTSSPAFAGAPTAPTAASGTSTAQLATTAFVTEGPAFAGIPTAPTAGNSVSNSQLATTEFVQNQKNNTVFTGIPTAPTAAPVTNTTQLATTEFVQLQKSSPAFTGTPTAPTALAETNTTQIATTQFVKIAINDMPSMSKQNANAVEITGGTITGVAPIPIASGGTGSSTASAARSALGLGTMATQNSNEVTITGGNMDSVAILGGTVSGLTSPLPIASGGTGSNTAGSARSALGLGSMATQNSSNVEIFGGSITGITPLVIADGGTGSNTPSGARTNLGLGTMATQNAANVNIGGGTVGNLTATGTISILQTPINGTDAVNKNYVDTLVTSRPLFFSIDTRGLSTTGTGAGSVVSILNILAPPDPLQPGTICRVAGTVQNVTANYSLSVTYVISYVSSVTLNGGTTVNNPDRNNNLVYQVNETRTSWRYVSG
jgi:hypothetical protein